MQQKSSISFQCFVTDIGTFVQYRAVRNYMALPLAESVLHVGNNEKDSSLDVVIDFDFFQKMDNADPVIAMLAIPSNFIFSRNSVPLLGLFQDTRNSMKGALFPWNNKNRSESIPRNFFRTEFEGNPQSQSHFIKFGNLLISHQHLPYFMVFLLSSRKCDGMVWNSYGQKFSYNTILSC